jgi:hypothetical protein
MGAMTAGWGCSGSSGGTPTTTPGSEGVAVSPTVRPGPTPFPTPELTGGVYTFPLKGYSIRPPGGWQARPNAVFDPVGNTFASDAFFSPDTIDGVQPNITVQCMKPRSDQASTQAFRDGWRQYVHQIVNEDVTPTEETLAGRQAYRFSYTQPLPENANTNEAKAVQKLDVLLVEGSCRWMFSLTAPTGSTSLDDVFGQALASVKFLN